MTRANAESLHWDELSIQEILELAIADEEDAREYLPARRRADRQHPYPTDAPPPLGHGGGTRRELREELHDLVAQRELEAGIAD